MTNKLSNHDKWNLIWKLSNEQSEKLSDEILMFCGKKEAPNNKVSYDDFCQILNNIKHSIEEDFNRYDKSGRYTNVFTESGLSVADMEIYKDSLIIKAAMNVAGNIFYTD